MKYYTEACISVIVYVELLVQIEEHGFPHFCFPSYPSFQQRYHLVRSNLHCLFELDDQRSERDHDLLITMKVEHREGEASYRSGDHG
jgi:hypothetical protein